MAYPFRRTKCYSLSLATSLAAFVIAVVFFGKNCEYNEERSERQKESFFLVLDSVFAAQIKDRMKPWK